MMNRTLFSRNALRLAALMVFSLSTLTASAQVKPFKVTGSGPAPDGVSILGEPASHFATGNGTLLGKYTGEGVFDPDPLDFSTLSGTFHGSFVFVAANGDELFCTYGDMTNRAKGTGKYEIFPAGDGNVFVVFLAEFNPVPEECTGRFKKVVDGSLLMLAVSEPFPLEIDPETGFSPPFDYSWEGKGWLEFEQGP